MRTTIAKRAEFGMAAKLTRRAFSGLAIAAAAAPRAFAAAADPFNYAGADRNAFLQAGAKREAKLTFYSSLIPNLGLKAIVDGFKKKYAFVAVDTWRGTE